MGPENPPFQIRALFSFPTFFVSVPNFLHVLLRSTEHVLSWTAEQVQKFLGCCGLSDSHLQLAVKELLCHLLEWHRLEFLSVPRDENQLDLNQASMGATQ
jgi:ABC-type uncharacterized transport system permease subunit